MKINEYLRHPGWIKNEIEQMEYFRSLPLLMRIQAVEGMCEVVDLFQSKKGLREQHGRKVSVKKRTLPKNNPKTRG